MTIILFLIEIFKTVNSDAIISETRNIFSIYFCVFQI